jgi:hypothetical protein
MTIERNLATCDGGCGSITRVASDLFQEWRTLAIRGIDVHLCPDCQRRNADGARAADQPIECALCGRESEHDREQIEGWIAVRDGSSDEMVIVCSRCFEEQTEERIP